MYNGLNINHNTGETDMSEIIEYRIDGKTVRCCGIENLIWNDHEQRFECSVCYAERYPDGDRVTAHYADGKSAVIAS